MKTALLHLTFSSKRLLGLGYCPRKTQRLSVGHPDTFCGSYTLLIAAADVATIAEQQPVDELAHGLDRVLFKYVKVNPLRVPW